MDHHQSCLLGRKHQGIHPSSRYSDAAHGRASPSGAPAILVATESLLLVRVQRAFTNRSSLQSLPTDFSQLMSFLSALNCFSGHSFLVSSPILPSVRVAGRTQMYSPPASAASPAHE